MKVEVSNGELVDKITILKIKLDNINDLSKLYNVRQELQELTPMYKELLNTFAANTFIIQELVDELLMTNKILWDIEDRIREKEILKEFDEEFISLARSVYVTNDKRAHLKKEINLQTGSVLVEEKSYNGT
jgi:hypothetical protein